MAEQEASQKKFVHYSEFLQRQISALRFSGQLLIEKLIPTEADR